MAEICGISLEMLPELHESFDAVGTLKPEVAAELGLPETCKVVAGAGDNAAAAVGTGTVGDGMCNVSLGTSGTRIHFQQQIRRRQPQCPARIRTRRRPLSPDGMHAECSFLQQMVDG